jgi:hypothetical protein
MPNAARLLVAPARQPLLTAYGIRFQPGEIMPILLRHALRRVCVALAVLAIADGAALAQPTLSPHPVTSPQTGVVDLDDSSKSAILQAIQAQLDRSSLHLGNLYYTQFDIADEAHAPGSFSGGFAPPLMPRAAPIVRHGLIEVTPLNAWSVAAYPIRNSNSWKGEASLRLYKYRVFTPERGLQADQLLMLHFWEWSIIVDNGTLTISQKIDDPARAGSASAPQELIAAIYNVPPETVSIAVPSPDFVGQMLNRSNGSSSDCQRSLPNGRHVGPYGANPC